MVAGCGFLSLVFHDGYLYAGGSKNSTSSITDVNLDRHPIIMKIDYQLSGIVWAY